MCEHARSTGFAHTGRSPSSNSGGLKPLFPIITEKEEAPGGDASKSGPGPREENGFYRRVYPSIRNLFLCLQNALTGEPLPHSNDKIASVSDMLESLDVDDKEWADFARFDGKKYTRNLVAHDSAFTVLLLCWNKGQRSPIHDHAGSSCWVKVLKGNLRERRFGFPSLDENGERGPLELTGDCTVSKGQVCYINDSQGIHEMGNPSDDEVTVTLHVYCPAYYSCLAFNETDSTHRCVSMLAAAAPQREVLGPEVNNDATQTKENAAAPQPKNALSLPQFAKLIDNPSTNETSAVEAFNRLYLGKSEWSSFVHFNDHRFQRLMLHSNHRFSLLMLCWLPGQKTPPHDHKGSRSWVKVLSGQLSYHEVDGDGKVAAGSEAKLTASMTNPFVEDDTLAVHVVGNDTETFAVSLHFYSPPYTDLTYTDFGSCDDKHTNTPPLSPSEALRIARSGSSQAMLDMQHSGNLPRSVAEGGANNIDIKGTSDNENKNQHHEEHVIPYAVCQQALSQINNNSNAGGCGSTGCRLLSNFFILQEKLGMAFTAGLSLKDMSLTVLELLEEQIFSPSELEQYWQIRDRIDYRVRLHDSDSFCVSLNLWDPEQESVIHDHDGSLSWIKVLDGALMDTLYEENTEGTSLEESNTSRLITGSVTFYGVKAKHALANVSKTRRAISLHVYCSRDCIVDRNEQIRREQEAVRRKEIDSLKSLGTTSALNDSGDDFVKRSQSENQIVSRGESMGTSFFKSKRSLVMFGTQQACRWYTRGAPKSGIRVMSLTAVEDINWKVEAKNNSGGQGRGGNPFARPYGY